MGLFKREARIESRSWQTTLLKRVNLILHQSDQGRDDQGHPLEHHRRELIAKRLPATGWKDGQR